MIAIVDYGLGNIKNVSRAIDYLGFEWTLTSDPSVIKASDCIVLPGVGHFNDAMRAINETDLLTTLSQITDKPMIGICLGMQLLYEYSEEGQCKGLGYIPGNIELIKTKLPIPHLGWNTLHGIKTLPNNDVYFVHSYQAPMDEHVVAYAEYGSQKIPAIVQYQNVIGIQFHPEKSDKYGLEILSKALKGGFLND